jgi:hypothetical protein
MRKDFLYWTYLYSTTKVNEICSIEYYKFCPESEKPKSLSQFTKNGYIRYDPVEEYKRQGIPNQHWRVDTVWNMNYAKIPSYPQVLIFPQAVPSPLLEKAVSLRTRNRMPVLCYLYSNGAAMLRSSQPRRGVSGGVTGANSKDEQYLEYIALATNKISKTKKLYVFDARSFSAAQANRAIGGGFEDYKGTKVIFLDIENIHVVRESCQNLLKLCGSKNEFLWSSKLGETNWLSHIYRTIRGAQQIVETMFAEKNVLVHCSDGWDRTAQLTSIVMLLLDPHYRTINGFELLIEKEWLSFGHQFQLRTGVFDGGKTSNEESPIFLQFLEMVWCLMGIYPNAFEFNEDFLIQIFDHLYSCLFGTFIYDCEKDRRFDTIITDQSVSLWLYLDSNRPNYTNPLYIRLNKPITAPIEMKNVQIWRNVWLRWDDQSAYSSNLEKIQLRELYLAVLALKVNPKIKQDNAPSRGHSSSKDVIPLPLHRQATTSSPLIKTQIPPPQQATRINVISAPQHLSDRPLPKPKIINARTDSSGSSDSRGIVNELEEKSPPSQQQQQPQYQPQPYQPPQHQSSAPIPSQPQPYHPPSGQQRINPQGLATTKPVTTSTAFSDGRKIGNVKTESGPIKQDSAPLIQNRIPLGTSRTFVSGRPSDPGTNSPSTPSSFSRPNTFGEDDFVSEDRDSGTSPRSDLGHSPREVSSPRDAISPREREVIVPIVSPRPGSSKPAWLGKPIVKKDNL